MTDLGQLSFTLFTDIGQTRAAQKNSVNMAIIHSYSTLPRNGRMQMTKPKLQVYTRLSDKPVLLESARSEDRRLIQPDSEELKTILERPLSVVRNHTGCPTLIRPIFYYAHLVSKGSEMIRRKTLGHSVCDIIGCCYVRDVREIDKCDK